MTKREKIIVAVMILTVAYGAFNFFSASPSKKPKQNAVVADIKSNVESAKRNKLIKDISTVVKENETVKVQKYIAKRAEEDWRDDPFASSRIVTGTVAIAAGADKEIRFTYSGYLEIGKKKIAVINGIDYQKGDELEVGEFRVVRIYSSKVLLMDARKGKTITVPFLEE